MSSSRPTTNSFTLDVPDELPPVEGPAAKALLDLIKALAEVELGDHDCDAA